MRRLYIFLTVWVLLVFPVKGEEVSFSILATGDLHSRFEPHVDPFHLGGMARLKTAMDQIEGELTELRRPVLRLDAGDCSEGSIYFNSGAGVASFDLMNALQYDAVVLGNHDWYLGPTLINRVLDQIPPQYSFLSANLNWKNVPSHPLKDKLKNYEVFYLVGGTFLRRGDHGFEPDPNEPYFKVGVFGLSTHEPMYSFFFEDRDGDGVSTHRVVVTNPLAQARREVLALRKDENVDVIILLSHMLDDDDLTIAERLTSVQMIVGGHSHHKVVPLHGKPIVVNRGTTGDPNDLTWVIKTGEFGQFLGQADLVFDTTEKKMVWEKSNYRLHQVDDRYSPDRQVQKKVDHYKTELREKYRLKDDYGKDIFSDAVAVSDINLFKSGVTETFAGNLVASAILEKAKPFGAQFAVNNSEFLSHGLYQGRLSSAMIYNMFPLIYHPVSDHSWTIWVMDITGAQLKKAIDLVFMMGFYFDVAGIDIVYDPTDNSQKVMSIKYNGEELKDEEHYTVAASEGIVEALRQVREEIPGVTFRQTPVQIWHALRETMAHHSPIRASDREVQVSGRIRTVQPDLVILGEEMQLTPVLDGGQRKIRMRVTIKNVGYGGLQNEDEISHSKTKSTRLKLYYDGTPGNSVDNINVYKPPQAIFSGEYGKWTPSLDHETLPENVKMIETVSIPPLGLNERTSVEVVWDVTDLPSSAQPYEVYGLLEKASGTGYVTTDEGARQLIEMDETNLHNNKAQTFLYLNVAHPLSYPFKR